MKYFWQSMVVAFGMYSKIPVPKVVWQKENMRYAFCFLPLVGLVIGMIMAGWLLIAQKFSFGDNLRAAIAVFLPAALSGGIHLDGFCDTVDALSCHQRVYRKQEILKDPHIGAFALIWVVIYLLVLFGLWSQITVSGKMVVSVGVSFVLSRAYGASRVIKLSLAREDGLAAEFAQKAQKKTVYIVLMVWLVLALAVYWYMWLFAAIIFSMLLLLFSFWYGKMVETEFSGINGDLAGFAVEIVQLLVLLAILAAEVIER